jgi:hypothetical protein
MKQSVNPAVFVVAIVIVVALAGFFGYRMMTQNRESGPTTAQMQQKMQEHPGRSQNPNGMGSPGSGAAGSYGGYGGPAGSGGRPMSGGSPR